MKKLLLILFLISIAFSSEPIFETGDENEIPPERARITLPQRRARVQPIIEIDGRNLSVVVPAAPNMRVEVFTPNGRRIARTRRQIDGEKAVLTLPRSARKNDAVIVSIHANREFYSQRISLSD